jgi:hypothetical protein
MTTSEDSVSIKACQAQFAEQDLPFPPLPEAFQHRLVPFNEWVFASRELEYGPYAADVYAHEVLSGEAVEDYALLGFDGHGINSWAVHYFLVQGALGLFVQAAWGGAYLDENAARETIQNAFEFAETLTHAMELAASQDLVPAGRRLVVLSSDFRPSGWGWSQSGQSDGVWHDDADMFQQLQDEVDSLFAS